MLYNKNKSCVKSCQKNIAFKKPLFSKKTHCFQTCALFYPIVLKRKIITDPNPVYTYTLVLDIPHFVCTASTTVDGLKPNSYT